MKVYKKQYRIIMLDLCATPGFQAFNTPVTDWFNEEEFESQKEYVQNKYDTGISFHYQFTVETRFVEV